MLAKTPPRPPVDLSDPMVQLLLTETSPDLTAPPRPRIVNDRCGGNLAEKEVFDSLHYLTLLYEATGRKDFTAAEIHRYAIGVSLSRIPTYLRGLCDKGLVDVTGHREIKGLHEKFWTAHYKIDMDRLRNESALIVASDLRRENQPPPLRRVRPSPGQTELPFDAQDPPPYPDDHGDRDGHPSPTSMAPAPQRHRHRRGAACHARRSMAGPSPRSIAPAPDGQPCPQGSGSHAPTSMAPASDGQPCSQENGCHAPTSMAPASDGQPCSQENGSHAPTSMAPASDGQPCSQENGSHAPTSMAPASKGQPCSQENGSHALTSMATGLQGAAMLPGDRQPCSQEIVVGMWGGRDGGGEVGGGETHAPTPDEIRLMIRIELHEALSSVIGASFTPAAPPPHDEPIPPAPADEPAVNAGPLATWANLTGRPTAPLDGEKIAEVVRRFAKPSGGHAAYWLVRALTSVALEDQAPLTITYAGGILRRMADRNDWSTDELMRRPKEQRAEAVVPTAAPPERVARGKAKPAPAAPAPESAIAALPAELEAHWALASWRRLAGPAVAITVTRAQQIIVRVTDRPAWEAVLANWHAQYQAKANWAHFDGLLERYDREIAAAGQPASGAQADIPHIPASVIDQHPALRDDHELNRIWRGRYTDATSKPAKQVVLRRLLAEHPLPPALIAALNVPDLSSHT
ncbi:hypothetical protein EKD04_017780 [Chloroflexales bacterium ZM16-3]|nr:hypothetical protein [Chloroflexales bacterium ZM16-3]